MENFDEFLEHYVSLLPSTGNMSPGEAEQRAGAFLEGMAKLTAYKHQLGDDLIKATTLRDVAYAQAIKATDAKNAETRKADAEANPNYISAREEFESIQNKLYTIKTYQEIFLEASRLNRKSVVEMNKGF